MDGAMILRGLGVIKPVHSSGRLAAHRAFIQLWGFHFRFVCFGGGGDGRSGTQIQGAGGQPGSAPCSCVTWQTSEETSPEGVSTTSYSVLPGPLGGVGRCFLAAVAGFMGISEGNDGGDFPRAVRPEFFGRAHKLASCRLMLWTFHRLDGWGGRGTGPGGMRGWRPRPPTSRGQAFFGDGILRSGAGASLAFLVPPLTIRYLFDRRI